MIYMYLSLHTCTLNMCNIKIDNIFLPFFYKDERSDKRNQILQKAVANWLSSEGNTEAAFMVVKTFSFWNIRGPRYVQCI